MFSIKAKDSSSLTMIYNISIWFGRSTGKIMTPKMVIFHRYAVSFLRTMIFKGKCKLFEDN